MSKAKRALRRHHRERLIKKTFKRDSWQWPEYPQPHCYFVYDLENEDDFLEFLTADTSETTMLREITDEDGTVIKRRRQRLRIYVVGQGLINPRGTWFDNWSGTWEEYREPPYDWDDVYKNRMERAVRRTAQGCNCPLCTSPRREFGRISIDEYLNRIGEREQYEENNIHYNRPRVGKTRWNRW